VLKSKIIAATVYSDRALVTRVANGSFAAGQYTLRIPGLPDQMNDQSIRVAGAGSAHAKILEVRVEPALPDSLPDVRARELLAEIENIKSELRKLDDRAKGIMQQREFLGKISIASSDNFSKEVALRRPALDDWQKVLSFLDANTKRLGDQEQDIGSRREAFRKHQTEVEFELNKIGAARTPRAKQAFISLDVTQGGTLNLEVSYLVRDATWEPLYDLRASTSDKKIELTYNAQVWQGTGEDWENVTLSLSTAQPVVGGSQPTLSPWFVDVYGGTKGAIQGFVRDVNTGEPLAVANATLVGRNQGAATNLEGFFLLQNVEPGDYDLRISLLGYTTKTVRVQVVPYHTTRADVQIESEPIANEGIVVMAERPMVQRSATSSLNLRGGRANEVVTMMPPAPAVVEHATAIVQSGIVSAVYQIGTKATIQSGQAQRKVTIALIPLSSEFKYSSTPRLQPKAYFKGKAVNSSDIPLLAGSMSVFVDNNYVSSSRLSSVMPGESLEPSLGVDDGIRIERKILNKLTETSGLFTHTKKTSYDILITIENLKSIPVVLTVLDNIPISRNEKIKVVLDSPLAEDIKPDAEGLLQWKLEMKPAEKKEIHIRFSVEVPTDLTVSAME
jgi:hypothetical protein